MKTTLRKTASWLAIVLLLLQSCTPSPATAVACNVPALIKAIDNANADAAPDVLDLASGCVYTLTEANKTVTSTTQGETYQYGDVGLPPIATPITINGNSATITRADGSPEFRIFHILQTGDLTLNDLTITNGFANRPGDTFWSSGGAIYNQKGLLTVNRSTLRSNHATFHGGAIFDFGATTYVKDSTISDNTAPLGAGIFMYGSTLLSITGSTITNNNATVEGGGINVGHGAELVIRDSVISFNHSTRHGGGIFKTNGSESLPTTISGCTFEGNTAEQGGGAILIWGTPLTIMSSWFFNNQAGEYGGGLAYDSSSTETVNIRDTTFDGNSAGLGGGALHFSGELLKIIGSTFRNNTAEDGGAIHNAGSGLDGYIQRANSTIQIGDSTIEKNIAKAAGGGIFNGGTLSVDLSSLTGNKSTSLGGGIHNLGTMLVQDSTFKMNRTGFDGGGLNTYKEAMVVRSSFVGNSAARGGGLASIGGNTVLINDTFSGNSASTGGGGIFNMGPTAGDQKAGGLGASHITVAYNRAATGGGIATSGGLLKMKNSIIALSTSGGDCSTGGSDFSAVAENLDSDDTCAGFTLKEDPLLEALADNGGPTQTHALQVDSLALDAAPDCTILGGAALPRDQRGQSRPAGEFCDLGAYERVQEKNLPTAQAITPTLVKDLTLTPTPLNGITLKPNDLTLTPTLVKDITETPTPSGPIVTAKQNANCRYGPGTVYDIADTLFAGQTAPLVGRNERSTWWQVRGPTFGSLCWVSKVTVDVTGSTEGVPVGVAPPPPTLTPEPHKPQNQPKQGCYVYDASGARVCTVPCPANAQPGGACTP